MPGPMRIGLVLFPGCMPAGLLAFADLVHAANRRSGRVLFELRRVAGHAGDVACAHGVVLRADGTLSDRDLDAVLVPGFWAESIADVERALDAHAALVATLARLRRGCEIWSYCTGVCLLAASGRLDRRAATVAWWLAETMRTRHPRVDWQCEHASVVDGTAATASGVAGWLPIAQVLVERRVDAAAFRDLARLMVLPRPERMHGAFEAIDLASQRSAFLRRLHRVVTALPAVRVNVEQLARSLGVSARTLARKVADEAGEPVAAYARRIKLHQVGERLVLTRAPVAAIGEELGFSSDANLARMFKRITGMTPAQYRQAFSRA